MIEHISEGRLNDYVDGLLPTEEQRSVERHLEQCATCRAELQGLHLLLSDLAAIPREFAPARDLRPAIAARTGRRRALRVDLGGIGRHSLWSLRYALAAAAVLLVVASSVVTRLLVERGPGAPGGHVATSPPLASAASATLVEFRSAEARYLRAIAELQAALDRQRATLTPQTVELLERNLRIIDRAIRESRAALTADPSNLELTRMIMATYEQKLGLLRRAQSSAS